MNNSILNPLLHLQPTTFAPATSIPMTTFPQLPFPHISNPPGSSVPHHNMNNYIKMSLPTVTMVQGSQDLNTSQSHHSSYQYIGGGGISSSSYQIPTNHDLPNVENQQPDILKEIQDMKDLIKNMKEGINKRPYSFQEIFPCPYNPSISITPYPPGFEMPKFKKYKGEDDPRYHVYELCVLCEEVSYSDIYLRILFPKNLIDQALAWFSTLPQGSITSFHNLVKKIMHHYAYNIENVASMIDLCNTK